MKFDIATRREELLRERAKIEQQIAALHAEHKQSMVRFAALRAEHEQSMAGRQSDLRVIEARLEEIENFAAALGPDFSGRAPIAGGPVEPIRRSANRDIRALICQMVEGRPGITVKEIARELCVDKARVENYLIKLQRDDIVMMAGRLPDTGWWPAQTRIEGPQDTESEAEAQTPSARRATPMDGNHG